MGKGVDGFRLVPWAIVTTQTGNMLIFQIFVKKKVYNKAKAKAKAKTKKIYLSSACRMERQHDVLR
jgi:hypothetical protein